MRLTDTEIRVAIKAGVRRKLFDGGGLFLLVDPPKQPGWRLKYSFAGSEKGISLGLYRDVPLKRARMKRDEARRLLDEGIDPSAARRAARADNDNTFKAVATEWLGQQHKLSAKTIEGHRARLTRWVFPKLGSMPIAKVTATDVLAELRKVAARGIIETTRRARSDVSRVMRFAVATGRAERDVTLDLAGALPTKKTKHFAAITNPVEFGALLRAIDGYRGQPVVELALKMAPYIFLRPGELRAGRWSEVNLDAAEWRIPAERMKMRQAHIVPLATQMVDLLRELNAHTGGGTLMFPTSHDPSRPMSDNTLNSALRRLGYLGDQHVAHGFRSSASSMLNELGVNRDLIELQLAHKDTNEVRGIYNRSERLADRREMMQQWADYIDGLRRGASVVAIKREARGLRG